MLKMYNMKPDVVIRVSDIVPGSERHKYITDFPEDQRREMIEAVIRVVEKELVE
jgi:hypothetical protein